MKFEKSVAGYHMLVILSEVDGYFDAAEKKIVQEYARKNLPKVINLEVENRVLSTLPKSLYREHFEKVANDFYWQSTLQERNNFINFAFKLIKADKAISNEENTYINLLYDIWDLSIE